MAGIPLRPFGRHDVKVSVLAFGGHHLGDAEDEATAVQLVRDAVTEASPSSTTAGNITTERARSGWARG
jgi:hypothetical protein